VNQGGKILIVDDEHLSAMVMDIFLRERGYEVRVASTAEEALRITEGFMPDLLLTDHLLGDGMSGTELARALEQRNGSLQTFVLTGLPLEDVEPRTSGLQHARVFVKPVDLDVLHEAIRSVVHSEAH
jgi:DNA-binding response OmpR family regulator